MAGKEQILADSMNAKDHLADLHSLPCIVHRYLLDAPQVTRSVAHHLESIRDSNSDWSAIPLCDDCHKQLHSMSRRGFERFTKLTELDMLSLTIRAIRERE